MRSRVGSAVARQAQPPRLACSVPLMQRHSFAALRLRSWLPVPHRGAHQRVNYSIILFKNNSAQTLTVSHVLKRLLSRFVLRPHIARVTVRTLGGKTLPVLANSWSKMEDNNTICLHIVLLFVLPLLSVTYELRARPAREGAKLRRAAVASIREARGQVRPPPLRHRALTRRRLPRWSHGCPAVREQASE